MRAFEPLEPRVLLTADPIVLGPQTGLFDQPYVDIEVSYVEDDVVTGLGPYGSVWGMGLYPYNHFLLDTGTNGILSAREATEQLESERYATENTFRERGVGGTTEFDVSAPYRFEFQGSDGATQTLEQTDDDVRILSSDWVELGGPIYPYGIAGLVGMPAMAGRVTSLDFSAWAEAESIFDLTPMEVTFSADVDPAPYDGSLRYSVAVDDRVSFQPDDPLPDPEDPPNEPPYPSWAPVPLMTGVAEFRGTAQPGNFLVDTGAQMSMISSELAFAVGLDEDGDGNFQNEAFYTITIGGVGGQREVPVLLIDAIRLPTQQGVDLVWTGTDPDELGLEVIVLDIDPQIHGIFGVDLLTAGLGVDYGTLEVDRAAYFDRVHFDFRDMYDGSGVILFDLHPYRAEIAQSDGTTEVTEVGDTDTYEVVLRTQSAANVTIHLDCPDGQITAVDDAHPDNDFLVFTPDDWDDPQVVRIAAVDDELAEGPHRGVVTHAASSPDSHYNNIRIAMVTADIVDDDAARVVGRHVFYNNSAFDGNTAAAGVEDDGAIAPDKVALLPGETAGFANYTSYSRGLNGIMVDVDGLPDGVTPGNDDFEFKVGNDEDPEGWDDAPDPAGITVRRGHGASDSDRVTIIWDDNAIGKQWLQVRVLAGARTGLLEDDVFYFGNAVGESGNSTADAKVNAYDMLGARDNQRTFIDPAPIDFNYDFNRDARVNTYDMLIARDNQTHFLNALKLITVPESKSPADTAIMGEVSGRDAVLQWSSGGLPHGRGLSLGKLSWLYEFEQSSARKSLPKRHDAIAAAVNELVATY